MIVENSRDFISLQDILEANPTPGRIGVEFGVSPISFMPKEASKPAKRAERHLRKMVESGILDSSIRTGDPALIHDLNNTTYVRLINPEGRDWFVHPRVLLQRDGRVDYVNEFPLQDTQEAVKAGVLHVISGMCLFGATGALITDESGNKASLTAPMEVAGLKTKVTALEVTRLIHPYELDSILKVTSFIGNFNRSLAIEITFHIPRIEYWVYGISLYEKGLMDSETLLDWFNKVNMRSTGIEKLLKRRFPEGTQMSIICPFAPAERFLLEAVQSGKHGIQGRVVEILGNEDPLWASLLRALQGTNSDLLDLNHQSYVYAYLSELRKGNGLLVAVENPEEISIQENTKRVIGLGVNKDLKQPGILVGLFVHPNLIVPDGKARGGRKVLFFLNGQSLADLKKVANSYAWLKNKKGGNDDNNKQF